MINRKEIALNFIVLLCEFKGTDYFKGRKFRGDRDFAGIRGFAGINFLYFHVVVSRFLSIFCD